MVGWASSIHGSRVGFTVSTDDERPLPQRRRAVAGLERHPDLHSGGGHQRQRARDRSCAGGRRPQERCLDVHDRGRTRQRRAPLRRGGRSDGAGGRRSADRRGLGPRHLARGGRRIGAGRLVRRREQQPRALRRRRTARGRGRRDPHVDACGRRFGSCDDHGSRLRRWWHRGGWNRHEPAPDVARRRDTGERRARLRSRSQSDGGGGRRPSGCCGLGASRSRPGRRARGPGRLLRRLERQPVALRGGRPACDRGRRHAHLYAGRQRPRAARP